jgi:outer membrane receptor for ferric coprogen and ferric-rhodotorulic acid
MNICKGRTFRASLLASTVIAGSALTAGAQTAAPGQTIELEQITVQGEASAPQTGTAANDKPVTDPAATEGSQSYTSTAATIGGKGAVPLRQIPQSVTVITRERIEDQNFTQLEDIARQTVGLHVLRNDPGRSSIYSRGFELDNAFINGLPAPLSSIYGTQPDLAIFDRVEVLRGPAALYSGSSEPGGSVNLVLKRPTADPHVSGSVQAGSFKNFRGEIDVSGPVVKSQAIRARIVAAFQDRESVVDTNDNQIGILFGTVEADITDDTTLTVSAFHQERQSTPFNGLPAYANGDLLGVGRSTFIGADWNRFENQATEGFVELEHRFENGGRAKASVRVTDREVDFLYGQGGSAVGPTGNITRGGTGRKYWESTVSTDAHVDTPFDFLGLTHNLVVGIDYRRYVQTAQNANVRVPGTTNVFNPISNWPDPTVTYAAKSESDPQQLGVYSQLRLKPAEPVTVVLGGRVGWYDSETRNLTTGAITGVIDEDAKFIPNAALILDVTKNVSLYTSYAESFQPQTVATDVALPPRESESYEVGVKTSFFDGRLNGLLALFQQHDDNRAFSDVSTGGVFQAVGEVEVDGVEAEISGSPVKGWDLFAGYTFSDLDFIRAPVAQNGQAFSSFVPRHVFTLFSKYEFQDGILDDWSIGGGVKVSSSFYNVNGTARFEEDGYVTADAQVGYDFNDNISAALTVTNLFDEKYYERVGSATVFNFYGEPRAYTLKVNARF